MSTLLRPLTTGELLDRTFHLYRNNFVLFAGIASVAAATVVMALMLLAYLGNAIATQTREIDPSRLFLDLLIYFGVLALFYILGSSLATGGTIYAVSKVHLGQSVSISESYGKVLPNLGRILVVILAIVGRIIVMLVVGYVCLFVFGLMVGLIFAGYRSRGVFMFTYTVGLVGGLTIYVLAIRLYFKLSVAIQACMLENTGTRDSLRRSIFLTRDYLWRIFLIYLLTGVIGFALSFVLHWPAALLTNSYVTVMIWQSLATFIATTLSFPISTIATSLLYYDLRVRKEALDLQLMMESLGQTQNQAAAAPIG